MNSSIDSVVSGIPNSGKAMQSSDTISLSCLIVLVGFKPAEGTKNCRTMSNNFSMFVDNLAEMLCNTGKRVKSR